MPGGHFYSYGLGLLMHDYAGHKVVWHAGDIDGMASAMVMVPDQQLGIVVMTNIATYADKYNGTAKVTLEKGQLVLRLDNPSFVGDMQHWHDDTFRVSWRYRYYGDGYVTFGQNLAGAVDTLALPQMSLRFERAKPSKEVAK